MGEPGTAVADDVAPARRQPGPGDRSRLARRVRRTVGATADASVFLVPKLLLFAAFTVVPFGYTFVLMFQRGSILAGFEFVGTENLEAVFTDWLFLETLRNTALYMVMVVPLTLVVPMAVGAVLASRLRGIRYYRTVIYLPSLLSIVATGLIWQALINPDYGPVYKLVEDVAGLHFGWLSSGAFALVFVVLVTVWASTGFYSILFMAGFNDIPVSLLEAGRIDGADGWRLFWYIKLPLLRPVIQLVLVLVTISSIQVFDVIFVLTQGGPGTATYTVMWYIYLNVFSGGSTGYAAAMGVVMLLITLLISVVYIRGTRSEKMSYE